jgi:hypothetical protein
MSAETRVLSDFQYGARFAADEERLDRYLDELFARQAEVFGPVTTATALDAAPELGRFDG